VTAAGSFSPAELETVDRFLRQAGEAVAAQRAAG
jgi:hypothetical protein